LVLAWALPEFSKPFRLDVMKYPGWESEIIP